MLYKSDRSKKNHFEKEGKMRISILIFIYTIHFASLKVYKKIRILNQVVAEKTLTKNFHMRYIGVTEGTNEILKKRRQKEDKHLNFHLNNTLCLPEGVQ